jgi:8-oxo-dGTP pyrophosphatase MutT (NUDIX family)
LRFSNGDGLLPVIAEGLGAIEGLNGRWSSLENFVWRMIYRLAFPVMRIWWWLRRSRHEGALVATYVGDQVLLLRASYRRSWNFPGGGIRPAEAPEQAARREFQEETGLLVPVLKAAGVVEGFWDNRHDKVHFFELRLERLPALRIDHREIVEARLVSPGELGGMKLTGPVAAYFANRR